MVEISATKSIINHEYNWKLKIDDFVLSRIRFLLQRFHISAMLQRLDNDCERGF